MSARDYDEFLRENGCTRCAFHAALPPGYMVYDNGEGHTFWAELETERDGVIQWDRWASWRGAWADYRSKQAQKVGNGNQVSPGTCHLDSERSAINTRSS